MQTTPSLSVIAGDLPGPHRGLGQRARNHRISGTVNTMLDEPEVRDNSVRAHVEQRMQEVKARQTKSAEYWQQLRVHDEATARRTARRKPEGTREEYLRTRLCKIAGEYESMAKYEAECGSARATGLYGTAQKPLFDREAGIYLCDVGVDGTHSSAAAWKMVDGAGHIVVDCTMIGDPTLQRLVGEALLDVSEELKRTRHGHAPAELRVVP